MNQLKLKLTTYPDWDRNEQKKRNGLAIEILKKRRQKRLQITDEQEKEITEFFEDFQKLMDDFRPLGSRLYRGASHLCNRYKCLKKK
jgi:hypothetical protein